MFKLKAYQLTAVNNLMERKKAILLGGCGSGKTYMAVEIMNRLKGDILLITPLNLQKFWINLIDMTVLKKGDKIKAGVTCINREKTHLLDKCYFRTVIIDESSLFKNVSTISYKVVKRICNSAEFVYIMTGTICSNNLVDIYGQLNLIDGKLFPTKFSFQHNYMDFDKKLPNGINLFKKNDFKFRRLLRVIEPYITSISPEDVDTPAYKFNEVKGSLPEHVKKLCTKIHLSAVQEKMGICVTTPASLSHKKHQIASGGYYNDDGGYVHLHNKRVNFIADIISNNERVLVYYNYIFELKLLTSNFLGGVEFETRHIDSWNNKEIKLMFINCKSGSHGLNLQGGGNVIAYFSLPYSAELFIQGVSRLVRSGQEKEVDIYISLLEGSVDEKNYETLKGHVMQAHTHFNSILNTNV